MRTTNHLRNAALLLFNLLFFVTLSSGQNKGSGNVTKQERPLTGFSEIEAGSAFSIILEQGPTYNVSVETDDNYQEKIETVVNGGRLIISSLGMKNPTAMKIYITTPEISLIEIYGAARLNSTGTLNATGLRLELSGASKADIELNTEILNTEISGAAKANLSGNTVSHNSDVSGAANLNALNLTTLSTNAKISGAGKATINSTNEIIADISGAGSLSYYDNGQLQKLSKPGSFTITPENPSGEVAGTRDETQTSTTNGDSTLINIGDVSVEVYDGNATKITIGQNELEVDDDGNVKYKRNKKSRYDGHWGGFELGVNGYVNKDLGFEMPEGYEFLDLRMEKSINVKLNFYEQNFNIISNKLGFTTGLGFEWANYRFDSDVVLLKDGNDLIDNFEANQKNYTKSKLLVNYLNLPLMFEFQTNKHSKKNSFHIGAGLQTGLRIGSHTKNVYQEDGNKKKDKNPGDFHINPFKYDAMVRVGWGKLNLHANYSLNTLFKNNRGPELYPFTVGISLVSW